MKKEFVLRVDLESYRGIRENLPKLLDLLKKYNLKASFYLVMGGESNIFELIKYRKKMISSGKRQIKVWPFKEKIRMAFFPKDFVKENIKILKRILDEGHELGLHGWKHREWTRGLEDIDLRKRIKQAKKKYFYYFGREPVSFASPGFNTSEKVLKILKEEGIRYISDFSGERVIKIDGIKNVPMTLCGSKRTPIIEFLFGEGYNDQKIFEIIKMEIQKRNLSSFYIHDLFEARFKINLLENIFEYIKKNKILNKRIIDY